MKWRRTTFKCIDGSIECSPDDWTLESDTGRNLASIYLVSGGPKADQWFWSVLVDQNGRDFNGGTGTEATGRDAREAAEAMIPQSLR